MNSIEITSEREYHSALHRIFELMAVDPAPSTREGEELERLVSAVDRFENERFPLSCCAVAATESAARLLKLVRSLGAFYDIEQAVRWCESSQPLLDGQRPVDMMFSEKGAAEVDAVLARMRDGAHI